MSETREIGIRRLLHLTGHTSDTPSPDGIDASQIFEVDESTAPVEMYVAEGTSREEVLAFLANVQRCVETRWEKIVDDVPYGVKAEDAAEAK